MKEYSKPKVTIDLEEYNLLLEAKQIQDSELRPLWYTNEPGTNRVHLILRSDKGQTAIAYIDDGLLRNLPELKKYTFYIKRNDASTRETKTTS